MLVNVAAPIVQHSFEYFKVVISIGFQLICLILPVLIILADTCELVFFLSPVLWFFMPTHHSQNKLALGVSVSFQNMHTQLVFVV